MLPNADQLVNSAGIERQLADGEAPVAVFREHIAAADAALDFHFLEGEDAGRLTHRRAAVMDRLLAIAWQRCGWHGDEQIALIAVGGYGRGELHPGSDVDLMMLLRNDDDGPFAERLSAFIQLLWDIKLKVGSSVRSLTECKQEANQDVTVATNLMEARLLAGDKQLFDAMNEQCNSEHVWAAAPFFAAKLEEQQKRHKRYGGTAYKLEPNIKEGPGGLRDIQTIGWVAKRHFGNNNLISLVDHGFLTDEEYRTLEQGQRFLWRVRWGLHRLAGRPEERLGFDYQRRLAEQFGYQDDDQHLAVEKFMRHYYCMVMQLSRLNEMLLQLFHESLIDIDHQATLRTINRRFQARNGYLEVSHDQVFAQHPSALLELFVILAEDDGLQGVRATTIRLIRDNLYLIDDQFRDDIANISLFMEFMHQPRGITHELRHMNRYGVLAAYIPAFKGIVGQAQFDLFHAFTVDEHTLFVVRNLRRLFVDKFSHEFPGCSGIANALPKPELLYLAGLFHDIGKGRGGDHSELGAVDALAFCSHHRLSPFDAHLVAWLVRSHLTFSAVAQRQDISDPEVINRFAAQVGDALHLDYLYLLTVADVRATNPDMWNSWKEALFEDLYRNTLRALRRGLERPIEKRERITEVKNNARKLLALQQAPETAVNNWWEQLPQEYFLRFTAEEVAWHTQLLLSNPDPERPLSAVQRRTRHGGTEVFAYTTDPHTLFAVITALLERIGLNVHDARIIGTRLGHTLFSFTVLEQSGKPIDDDNRVNEIGALVAAELQQQTGSKRIVPHQKPPLRARAFNIPTEISFDQPHNAPHTQLEIITADRPGLLARISQALESADFTLCDARIATYGARVDDLFLITDSDQRPLDEASQERLRGLLLTHLNMPADAA